MYFLANRVQMVYATDIYDKRYLGGEAEPDVLIHPDKYAPFRYRSEHLKVLLMDARKLTFEEESFDFVFCLSSSSSISAGGSLSSRRFKRCTEF